MIKTPRGIRNNNPGNVRANPHIVWRGQSGVDPHGFLIFKDSLYGIRCMAMILRHYHEYHKCVYLWDYIFRWAPPTENNTDTYLGDVAERMGVSRDEIVDLHTQGSALVKAIIWHENGEQPYTDVEIDGAIHLSHIQ